MKAKGKNVIDTFGLFHILSVDFKYKVTQMVFSESMTSCMGF